ncbi:DUF2207 domain-containing protein [Ulvibacter sp. MAR_2010_11]|uniref:DUF2207 domain-containing protein n=1 Tax=Ulvibacter sp. MAR_2010_11 TaxID=1250229 RepID=UPI0012FD599B|nr:DUF2207 domain-containing protein [Ulvibacter sp. MAR_2010_11]
MIALFWAICTGFAQDFRVDYYKVDIHLSEEGYFDVVENYDLYFQIPKHGIYRTIQTNYDLLTSDGNQEKRKIKISNIEVPGYHFESPFDFVQKMSDNLEIKIGDANITLMGPQHYEIKYRVHNAFLFEEDGIHFYWNIKPDGWWANFNKIDFTIHLPENHSANRENFYVYSGITGTTTIAQDIEVTYDNGVFEGKSLNNFVSYPGQSVTVLFTLPPGSIKEIKPFWPFWTNYGYVFIIGFLIMCFYIIWKKFGKDDRVIGVTSYYPPRTSTQQWPVS